MLKVIKLRKKDYVGLEHLLRLADVVDADGIIAHPDRVYASQTDINKLYAVEMKSVMRQLRLRRREAKVVVDMRMLNLAPSSRLADCIKPGYIVVEVKNV